MQEEPLDDHRARTDISTKARRRLAGGLANRFFGKSGLASQAFGVIRRVATSTYDDGFIHAGNLAYLAILALFPFLIVITAIYSAIGEQAHLDGAINTLLVAMPPRVAELIDPVAHNVVSARQGSLLWIGALVGLWTAGSLVETIRDILHRSYRTARTVAFWRYRLVSTGIIFGSVVLLLVALSGQVAISAAQEIVFTLLPGLEGVFDKFVISRLIGLLMLFISIHLLFVMLTPAAYQRRRYLKWPGALLVASWWTLVTLLLPRVLKNFFVYDLTYGSLAGVMIALFFFWLVGLGMVVGAELNAALAELQDKRDKPASVGGGSASEGRETREECE
ncbi:MAG: YihY/virulence factor BrkB family protein [Novosphingobium sp.]|nr:YihY/virulence factor BrkB family protein [Novosphingobium sp.]